MPCVFPLIGLITGAVLVLFIWLAKRLGAGELFMALGGAAVPPSGYRRNTHGRLSRCDGRKKILRFPEKKLEILKDPHTGGICHNRTRSIPASLRSRILGAGIFGYLPAVIRVRGGKSAQRPVGSQFPKGEERRSGRRIFREKPRRRRFNSLWYDIWPARPAAGIMQAGAISGIICIVTAVMVFCYYYRMTVKEFGGMTGGSGRLFSADI